MFSGWFGNKPAAADATNTDASNEKENNSNEATPQQEGGVFSGAMSFMKGVFGADQLKVEESGDNKTDAEFDNKRKGLFAQLSGLVGKDVTSMISLPVWIFEPASFLQIMAEPLQYESLLQKAAETTNPLDRLELLAAFNCALYSAAVRTKKPFNPLLGETFEIVHGDKFKFIAEQVSHHPPIGVSETVAKDYTLQLETKLNSKFYGNSSEVTIDGVNHFILNKTGEDISWGHLVTSCHNIILGSMWLDHYGDLEIKNNTKGEKCVIKFQKSGWLGSGRYNVTGEIFDKDGKLQRRLKGKWNESLRSVKVNNGVEEGEETTIWTAEPQPDNKWHFSKFMLEEILNLSPEYEATLPPTDSRLRADRRALEAGDLDTAGKMKHEMEEAQRARKRAREAKGEHWTPKYFEKMDDKTHGHVWMFNHKYWVERDQRLLSTDVDKLKI